MKKLLALALVGLFAVTANAGQFYINENVAQPAEMVLSPSDTGSLNLYYALTPGDTLRGAQIYFTQGSYSPLMEVVDAIYHAPFDTIDRTQAGMPQLPAAFGAGIPLVQRAGVYNGYVYSAYDVSGANIQTAGTVWLDEIIIHCLGEADPQNVSIYGAGTAFPDLDTRTEFINGTNGAITIFEPYPFPTPFPGTTQLVNGSLANPYVITQIPEPATLALLAFGGLALIRRK